MFTHCAALENPARTQPVAGLQLSLVHWLLSLQLGGAPPTHWLLTQLSMPLHAFPSLQFVGGPKKPFTQLRI